MTKRLKFSPESIISITVYSIPLSAERVIYFGRMPYWDFRQAVWLSAGFDPEMEHLTETMNAEAALAQGATILAAWKQFYRAVYTNEVIFKIIHSPHQTPEGTEDYPTLYFDPLSVVQALSIENIPDILKNHVLEFHCNDYFNPAGALARKKHSNAKIMEYMIYHYVVSQLMNERCTCDVQKMKDHVYSNAIDPTTGELMYDDTALVLNALHRIVTQAFNDLELKSRIRGNQEYRKPTPCIVHT